MATINPFFCIRPAAEVSHRVAALPYDVYNRSEAKVVASKDPLSFLNIDRAETQFPDDVDTYADCVYAKAAELLKTGEYRFLSIKEVKVLYNLINNG